MTVIEAVLIIVITSGTGQWQTSQKVSFPDMTDCLVASLNANKRDGIWAFCLDVTGATE